MTQNPELIVDGLSIQLKPAPLLKRFIAACVDYGILTLATYIFVVVGMVLLFGGMASGVKILELVHSKTANFIGIAIGVLLFVAFFLGILGLYHAYFIWHEYKKGYTPGKKLFGLRVVSADHRPLSLRQCVLRDFMRYVDFGLLFPGPIAMTMNSKKLRLGDLMAGTMVVHSESQEEKDSFVYLSQADYLLIRNQLEPKFIPEAAIHEFLKFSHGAFVFPGRELSADEESRWVEFARYYLPDVRGIEENVVALRFFAEYCCKLQGEKLKRAG